MERKFTLEYWIDDGWYVGRIKEIPGVHGIHIMAVGWEDIVPTIVEKAGLLPRPLI